MIKKNICDLDAFIKKVDSKGTAVEMTHLDFYLFENGVSSGKFTYRPLLSSVCSCMFKTGSHNCFERPPLMIMSTSLESY